MAPVSGKAADEYAYEYICRNAISEFGPSRLTAKASCSMASSPWQGAGGDDGENGRRTSRRQKQPAGAWWQTPGAKSVPANKFVVGLQFGKSASKSAHQSLAASPESQDEDEGPQRLFTENKQQQATQQRTREAPTAGEVFGEPVRLGKGMAWYAMGAMHAAHAAASGRSC